METTPPPQANDDLDWKTFVQFASVDLGAPDLKNQALGDVWRAYDANMDRIRLMLLVPDLVGEIRQLMQNCADVARFRITGNLDFLEEPEVNEDINALFRALMAERTTHLISSINLLKTGDEKHDKQIDQQATSAILSRGSLITSSVQADIKLRAGLEHFIETSIVTAWTAFEAMSSDLWEKAINIHPKGLASLNAPLRYRDKLRPGRNRNRDLDSDVGD